MPAHGHDIAGFAARAPTSPARSGRVRDSAGPSTPEGRSFHTVQSCPRRVIHEREVPPMPTPKWTASCISFQAFVEQGTPISKTSGRWHFLHSAWVERLRNRRCLATWLLAPKSGAVGRQRFIGCQWMGFEPQRPSRNSRIVSRSFPPP